MCSAMTACPTHAERHSHDPGNHLFAQSAQTVLHGSELAGGRGTGQAHRVQSGGVPHAVTEL